MNKTETASMITAESPPDGRRTLYALPPGLKLNLGCGPVQPPGWVNVDGSNRAKLASRLNWLDRFLVAVRIIPPTEFNRQTTIFDIRKPFPYQPGAVAAIYAGEMLEHFTYAQAQAFLAECLRVLAPGGVLRVRVPDNYEFWSNYVREFEEVRTRPRSEWNDHHARWTSMFFRDICVRRPGLSSMGHFHKWAYDEVSLILEFERAGFTGVEKLGLHDSRIEDVSVVETRTNLIVEGVKPRPEPS
jgi:predicted SAM-dependent methyltransferase